MPVLIVNGWPRLLASWGNAAVGALYGVCADVSGYILFWVRASRVRASTAPR